jgi:carbamoyl-phosphate synthase large subunit
MTDPEFADATYVEPITPEFVELVIARSGRTRSCPRWAGRPR